MASQAENLDKGRPKGAKGMWNFFPMGYKEAAYQWVSASGHDHPRRGLSWH